MKECNNGLEETETCRHTGVLMVAYVVVFIRIYLFCHET